jgi:hypothetical protein
MAWPWESELPALAALSDQEAANAINALTVTTRRRVSPGEVLKHAMDNGYLGAVLASAVPEAALLRFWFTNPHAPDIDMDADATKAIAAAMVTASLMTTAQVASLDALATVVEPKYPHCWPGEVNAVRSREVSI